MIRPRQLVGPHLSQVTMRLTAAIASSLVFVRLVVAAVPSGAITVGSGGTYSTLTAALADTSRYVML